VATGKVLFPKSLHGKTRFAPDAKKQWLFLKSLITKTSFGPDRKKRWMSQKESM